MGKINRKNRIGQVVSDKMDKTVVVAVEWRQRHPKYGKLIKRITKFKAHNENNQSKAGDVVRIEESRPLSKTKRWRVREIVSRREIAGVLPVEPDVVIALAKADSEGPDPQAKGVAEEHGQGESEQGESETGTEDKNQG